MNPENPQDPREHQEPTAHRAVREQLGAYAIGDLGETERRAVEEHLAGCEECRADLAGLEAAATVLGRLDPAALDDDTWADGSGRAEVAALPPGGEQRLLDAVRREAATLATAPPAEPPVPLRRPAPWTRLAAAAAVVVGLGAAGVVGYAVAPDAPEVPLEAVSTETTPTIDATADLIPHTWGMEVRLTGSGFVEGARYRVVVVDETGRDHPAGQFVGIGARSMVCNLNSAVLRDDAVAFRVVDDQGATVVSSSFATTA